MTNDRDDPSDLDPEDDRPSDVPPTEPGPPEEDPDFGNTEVMGVEETTPPPPTGATKSVDLPRGKPAPARWTPPVRGQIISGYRLIGKLGEGAQGVVWKASSEKHHREVALKFVGPKGQVRGLWSRLQTEARVLLELTHSAIVRLYSIEEADGHLFLAMELIKGPTLHHVVADRKKQGLHSGLSIEECIWLVEQLTPALDLSSSLGITHRDIKPGNIMLTAMVEPKKTLMESGAQVRLCDFGIAYVDHGEPEGIRVPPTGTRPFMAPEVEQAQKPTWRADVFSLAATVLALHQGHSDNRQSTIETLEGEIAHAATKTPETGNKPFDAAIKRALSHRPSERFDSFDDFLFAISGGTRGSQAGKTWRGWRLVAAAGVVVAAAALFFAIDPLGLRRSSAAQNVVMDAATLLERDGASVMRGQELVLEFEYVSPGGEPVTIEVNGETMSVLPREPGGRKYRVSIPVAMDGSMNLVLYSDSGVEIGREQVIVDNEVALPNAPLEIRADGPFEVGERIPLTVSTSENSVSVFERSDAGVTLRCTVPLAGSEEFEVPPLGDEPSAGPGDGTWTEVRRFLLEDELGNQRSLEVSYEVYSASAIIRRLRESFPIKALPIDLWDLAELSKAFRAWRDAHDESPVPASAPAMTALMAEVQERIDALRTLEAEDPEAFASYRSCNDSSAFITRGGDGVQALYTQLAELTLAFSTEGTRSSDVDPVLSGVGARLVNEPRIARGDRSLEVKLALAEGADALLSVTPAIRGREESLRVVRDGELPHLSIVSPSEGTVVATPTIELRIQARDGTSGLRRVETWRRGGAGLLQSRELTGSEATLTLAVPLEVEGANVLVVELSDNVQRSQSVEITVFKDASPPGLRDTEAADLQTGQWATASWRFDEAVQLTGDRHLTLMSGPNPCEAEVDGLRWKISADRRTVTASGELPFVPADGLQVSFQVADGFGATTPIERRIPVVHLPWGAVPLKIQQQSELILDQETLDEYFGSGSAAYTKDPQKRSTGPDDPNLWFPRCIRHRKSDVTFVYVGSGSFLYGPGKTAEAGKAGTIAMSGFYLARTEISRRQYRRVAEDDVYVDERTLEEPELPAITKWRNAENWCARNGFRLPTEAQWEYAASGLKNLTYPWGDGLERKRANVRPEALTGAAIPLTSYADVGAHPDDRSWCGAINMCGNAKELCLDTLDPATVGTTKAYRDPTGPVANSPGAGTYQTRGGGRSTLREEDLTTHARSSPIPLDSEPYAGFRPVLMLE